MAFFRLFSSFSIASRSSFSPVVSSHHHASSLFSSFRLTHPTAAALLVPSQLDNPMFRRMKSLPDPGTPEYWTEAKKFNPDRIREKRLNLIGEEGERLGETSLYKALDLANEQNCLLRPVNTETKPIMARLFPRVKKQKRDELKVKEKIKEIKFSHKIAEHDAQVKINKILKLLATRHRVKVVIFYPSRRNFDPEISHNMLDYINNQIPETAGYLDQGKYYNEFATAFCYLNPVATDRELGKSREQQEVEVVQLRKKKLKEEAPVEEAGGEGETEEQEEKPAFKRKRLEKDEQYFRSGGRHGGVLDDRLDEQFYNQPSPRAPPKRGYDQVRSKQDIKKQHTTPPKK